MGTGTFALPNQYSRQDEIDEFLSSGMLKDSFRYRTLLDDAREVCWLETTRTSLSGTERYVGGETRQVCGDIQCQLDGKSLAHLAFDQVEFRRIPCLIARHIASELKNKEARTVLMEGQTKSEVSLC